MRSEIASADQGLPASGFSYRRLGPMPPESLALPPFADPHLRWLCVRRSPFTRQARSAMVDACLSIVRRQDAALDVEHVLLGILERTPSELFAEMIAPSGASSDALLAALEAALAPAAASQSQLEAIPVTVAARSVVATARRAASERGYAHIGTGPLLLGIAQQAHSLGSAILTQHGLTSARLRVDLSPAAYLH